ncbi:MAG: hypothetical protein QM639_05085 [Rhodocyclaceae bacterium]
MDTEITELELRVARLTEAFVAARTAGRSMAAHIAQLEAENAALKDKLATTALRLEAMLEALPVTEP